MILNMQKLIIFLSLILVITPGVYARYPDKGEIKVNFKERMQSRETVTLQADIDLSCLLLGTNEIVTFTPALLSLDGEQEITFEPVSVAGKRRAKSILRRDYFGRKKSEPSEHFRIVTKRKPVDYIPVDISLPFQKWMARSQMVIVEQTAGCCNNTRIYGDGNDFKLYTGSPNMFPEPYKPAYSVIYREAPKEDVKILQETYSAQLNFHVNKTNLLRDFGNNARVLAEADEIINRMKTDSLLTIKRIMVKGYASPEGNAASNQRLSEGRANAFVGYLHDQHRFYRADRIITAEGLGEDWEGLRKAVEQRGDFDDKERVLDILANTPDAERRKSALKSLSGGRTYKMMLDEIYPSLRRNEYTIEYEVRGFNAQEAQALLGSRPKLLSLEEMFMVANMYAHDTEEYKQVFDVAARIYPDSPIAQFNVGAMEIENGSYDTAIKRLEKFDTPDALNNLGVAYWYKGEYAIAREYLERAIEAGNQQAEYNLVEFEKWLETWDE